MSKDIKLGGPDSVVGKQIAEETRRKRKELFKSMSIPNFELKGPRMNKHIIICDIDGTIADLSHRLHFIRPEGSVHGNREKRDWNKFHSLVHEDAVHMDMKFILCALRSEIFRLNMLGGHEVMPHPKVMYVSGRVEACREATLNWLRNNGFPFGELYMRPDGDYRSDDDLKEEILDTQLKVTPDQVLCVLDDRNRVVNMWRRRGFRVLQVADGDF